MTENPLNHPSRIWTADRLAGALRNELLEYGHLLGLLRIQQQMVLEENLMELPDNMYAVNQQMRNISSFRKKREYWREETDADLPWGLMRGLLPGNYQMLLQALVDEINLSLENIQVLLRQNQQLNLRTLILL